MNSFMDFIKTDTYSIIVLVLLLLLIISFIVVLVMLIKTRKDYKDFMNKLGKGEDLSEMIKQYVSEVKRVEQSNTKLKEYYSSLAHQLEKCTQKIGIVRYSAFKDTGSDLSFALAMLDQNNNGIILNGIYSREMSNIYAKPIQNGESNYTISEEEKQAIEKAINSK